MLKKKKKRTKEIFIYHMSQENQVYKKSDICPGGLTTSMSSYEEVNLKNTNRKQDTVF